MFKDIPGYEGVYQISPYGIVISVKGGKQRKRKWTTHSRGYPRVSLSHNGIKRHFEVHRLVALTYLGEKKSGMSVNHKDGDKLNNHVNNLEYCTPRENTLHAHVTGLINSVGENNSNSKLSNRDIEIIRRLYERTNLTQLEIAAVFDIKSAHTSDVVRNTKRIEQDKDYANKEKNSEGKS